MSKAKVWHFNKVFVMLQLISPFHITSCLMGDVHRFWNIHYDYHSLQFAIKNKYSGGKNITIIMILYVIMLCSPHSHNFSLVYILKKSQIFYDFFLGEIFDLWNQGWQNRLVFRFKKSWKNFVLMFPSLYMNLEQKRSKHFLPSY